MVTEKPAEEEVDWKKPIPRMSEPRILLRLPHAGRAGYPLIMTESINSQHAPEPVGAYPHARRVANLLYLSGVGPRKRGSKDIPGVTLDAQGNMTDYDIEAQCRSCFDNVRAVLEDAGSRFENVVDVLVFLTDMRRDFDAYNRIYAEYFAGDAKPNPARTTIEISRLPQGGNAPIAIELKVIATID